MRATSDMIAVADSRSDAQWDTAIDRQIHAPGQNAEWPSRRHSGVPTSALRMVIPNRSQAGMVSAAKAAGAGPTTSHTWISL